VPSKRRFRLLLLPSLLLLLLLAEGAVRYFQAAVPPPENSPYMAHPAAGYVLRPSTPGQYPQDHDNYVNPSGFRDRDHDPVKPPRTLRILGIGDSHVYGDVAMHDNFLRVAERKLADLLPADAGSPEMVMMGVPGWGISNCTGALVSEGLPLHPDLVVLALSVGTDVTGIPITAEIIQGNLQFTGSEDPLHDALRSSRLFVLAEQIYLHRIMNSIRGAVSTLRGSASGDASAAENRNDEDQPAKIDVAIEQGGAGGGTEGISRGYLRFISKQLPLYTLADDPDIAELWQLLEAELTEFDAACRGADLPWMLLVVPEEIQVDRGLRLRALDKLDVKAEAYDFGRPQKLLAAFAADRGVPVLDPMPLLRDLQRQDSRLYIPENFHWNERGSLAAGSELAAAITEMVAGGSGENDAFSLDQLEK